MIISLKVMIVGFLASFFGGCFVGYLIDRRKIKW
jgi:hypothetical protein